MIPLSDGKVVVVTVPINNSVDSTAFTTVEIDAVGFDYCTIVGHLGATDGPMTVWKVQESDTSGSGMTDVTGLVASGSTGDGRLPQATDDGLLFGFRFPLIGRKRYIDVVATTGDVTTGTILGVIAILQRAKQAPDTTAEKGFSGLLTLPA